VKKLTELGETQFKIHTETLPEDAERYQTIYAKRRRSCSTYCRIALSQTFIEKLEIKGIKFAEVTLHVGLGTFNPVEKICQNTKWT
jgi:S-adenosylmethionine:tRNA ribosyltransferase-isomerase